MSRLTFFFRRLLPTVVLTAPAMAACPPEVGTGVTSVVHEPAAGSGYDTYAAGIARLSDGSVVVVGSEGLVIGTTDWRTPSRHNSIE